MFEVVKTISLFVYPLGIATLALLIALAFWLADRRRWGLGFFAFGFALLWISAMPVLGNWAMLQLEAQWPKRSVAQMPTADAVVVLGGAFGSGNGQFVYPDASGSVDRYWHAARLFHAGKAPLIVLSGGRMPHLTDGPTEAQAGRGFLTDLGVPESAIALDNRALTTYENARNIAAIVDERGLESLLVVTSASHMRRSLDTLSRVDARLVPAATDFSAVENMPFRFRNYLPSVSGLAMTTRAWHEIVGSWYYRLTT
ncbi:MAG: YdcF family protein [Wenzhouxiangella sp.]|nr:YdcF family protein [Wenzhouxiangella sp.]